MIFLAMTLLAVSAIACGRIDSTPANPVMPAGGATPPMLVPVEVTRIVTITRQVPVTVEVTRLSKQPVAVVPTVDIESAPYEVGSLTGTYGWSTETESQGCQMVVMHRLLMTSQRVLEFELLCNQGEPLGYLVAMAPL